MPKDPIIDNPTSWPLPDTQHNPKDPYGDTIFDSPLLALTNRTAYLKAQVDITTPQQSRLNVQLLGIIPTTAGQVYQTAEAIAGTAKGGGLWVAVPDTTTADNGGTIRRPSAAWVWKKQLQDGAMSVMDFGADGGGVVDDTAALIACGAASAVAGGDMRIPPGDFLISSNVTIAANVRLVFPASARIKFSGGAILTCGGGVSAPEAQQIFSGAIAGKVALSLTHEAYPEWWGHSGSGATEDWALAIQCSIAACDVTVLRAYEYRITSALALSTGKTLKGKTSTSTTLVADFSGAVLTGNVVHNISLQSILINPGAGRTITGVELTDSCTNEIYDIAVQWRSWGGVMAYPRIGLHFTGSTYYNQVDQFTVYHFGLNAWDAPGLKTRGVLLDSGGGVGDVPNCNAINIALNLGPDCVGPNWDTYVDSGFDSACVEVVASRNVIAMGEASVAKYPIINTGDNKYTSPSFIEGCGCQPWNVSGEMILDCPCPSGTGAGVEPKIDAGVIVGPAGQLISSYVQVTNQSETSMSGCVGLWTFDRADNYVIDRSGYSRNFHLTGTPTLVRGLHRDVLQLSPTQTIDPIDTTQFPLSSLFTIVFAVSVTDYVDNSHDFLGEMRPNPAGTSDAVFRMQCSIAGGGISCLGVPTAGAPTYYGSFQTMNYVPKSGAWIVHAFYVDCATGKFGAYNMGGMRIDEYDETVSPFFAGYLDGLRQSTLMYLMRRYGDSAPNIMTGCFDMIAIYNRKLDLREVVELSQHKRPLEYFGPSPTRDEGTAPPLSTNWPIGWYRENTARVGGDPRGWRWNGGLWVPDEDYPAEPLYWTAVSGCSVGGPPTYRLTKTDASGYISGGASSLASVAGDGYLEYTVSGNEDIDAVGLSHTDSTPVYDTIEYCMYLYNSGGVRMQFYESNVAKSGSIATPAGTVLRLQKTGTTVKCYVNGYLFYTSLTASATSLLVDVAMHDQTHYLESVRLVG